MEENKCNTSENITSKPVADEKPANIIDGIVKTLDQNADGHLDIKDVAIITDNIGSAAARAAGAVKDAGDQFGKLISKTKRDLDLKALRPLFSEDIITPDFFTPDLVRLTNMDKRHAVSEVCKGSIAHMSNHNGIEMLNIYKDNLNSFNIEFYPDKNNEIYYKDPCIDNLYIALDEYFNYLKTARVNELKRIAQSLGAKHFKISYSESSRSERSQKVDVKVKEKAGIHKTEETSNNSYSSKTSVGFRVVAERRCVGHEPIKPELLYFRNDSTMEELIDSRMDNPNISNYEKHSYECKKTSGIKINDAKKIEAVLRIIKCSLNINIVKEAESEEHRTLEYEIEF